MSTACAGEIGPDVNTLDPPGSHPDDGTIPDPDPEWEAEGEPDLSEHTFTPTDEDFLNPERGFYVGFNLLGNEPPNGHSLAIAEVRLDNWRNASLPQSLLDDLHAGFGVVRAQGFKVVLRFMYNASFGPDAPLARVLEHIDQLQPLVDANADVIAVQQAGFIGAWGEWHASTNGLDNPDDQAAVLDALLTALPESRSVQVRTPMYKDAIFPDGPMAAEEAWSGSPRARVGHHNDCFLASADDMGTFDSPVDQWRDYVAADGQYTAIGGETCAVYPARSDCGPAVAEMETQHWSYLNRQYHLTVLANWVAQGCEGEISRRLGYRFAIDRAATSETVAPGGALRVEVEISNQGFAAPFNRRPVFVVLDNGTTRMTARLEGVDARRIAPGQTTVLRARLRVPADAAPGTYRVSLRLPDDMASLRPDPRYAIRMANQGVWDETHGDNLLTDQLVVDPDAPGAVDPTATGFVEIIE